MSNRWLIENKQFCGLSITHRCQWLFIDAIDYSLINYWLLTDYSTFIILLTYYILLRISTIFLYDNYLSSYKYLSWTVRDDNKLVKAYCKYLNP